MCFQVDNTPSSYQIINVTVKQIDEWLGKPWDIVINKIQMWFLLYSILEKQEKFLMLLIL